LFSKTGNKLILAQNLRAIIAERVPDLIQSANEELTQDSKIYLRKILEIALQSKLFNDQDTETLE